MKFDGRDIGFICIMLLYVLLGVVGVALDIHFSIVGG